MTNVILPLVTDHPREPVWLNKRSNERSMNAVFGGMKFTLKMDGSNGILFVFTTSFLQASYKLLYVTTVCTALFIKYTTIIPSLILGRIQEILAGK